MNQKDLFEHTRIHLIAAAVGHQQCTKTESTLIPLPGTKKFIAIGTLPAIAKVLMVEPPASTPPSTAPAPQTDPQQSESVDKDRQFHRLLADFGAARFGDVQTARERLIAHVDSKLAKATQAAPSAPTDRELKGKTVAGWYVAYCEASAKLKEAEACIGRYEKLISASKAAPSAKAEPVGDRDLRRKVYEIGRKLEDEEHTDGEQMERGTELKQLSGVCDSCRGCGQDGDAPDANGEGGWIGNCWVCNGTGFTVDLAAPAPAVQVEDARNQALEDLLTRIDGAHENYERFGEVCVFEGEPMIHASTLVEIAALRESLRTPSTSQTSEQQGGE